MQKVNRNSKITAILIVLFLVSLFGFMYFKKNTHSYELSVIPRSSGREKFLPYQGTITAIWGDDMSLYTCGEENGIVVLKWDKKGNKIWHQTWDYSQDKEVPTGIWGNDDSVFVCGIIKNSNLSENSPSTAFVAKWNKNSTFLWSVIWNATNYDRFDDVWGDENALYVGGSINTYESDNEALLVKFDHFGNQLWYHSYPNSYPLSAIQGTRDHIYGTASNFMWKWDKEGTVVWNRTIPTNTRDIWIINDEIYLLREWIVILGTPGMVGVEPGGFLKVTSLIQKWSSEGISQWNQSKYIWARYYDDFRVPKSQLWGNSLAIFSCEDIQDGDSSLELLKSRTTISITQYTLNGTVLWNSTLDEHISDRQTVHSMCFWGDDENIYIFCQYIDLETLDIKTYFTGWGLSSPKPSVPLLIGICSAGLIIIISSSWVVLKPIRRYRRVLINKELHEIAFQQNQGDYENERILDRLLNYIEKYGTNQQKDYGIFLNKRNIINHLFQSRLNEQLNLTKSHDFNTAYDELIILLRDTSTPNYASYIDYRIVSKITELLKKVAEMRR